MVCDNYSVSENPEITLEVNPDDVNTSFLKKLKNTKINRISIGIQSLNNDILKFLNRRHNSTEAINAIRVIKANGINNVSCDLIYGIPGQNISDLDYIITAFLNEKVNHISAYHLSVEKGTELDKQLSNKEFSRIEESQSLEQYLHINKLLIDNNYIHYEVSNYSLPDFESKHNSLYWKNISYIGIGPSAHSYNGKTRQWNISSINEYLKKIIKNEIYFSTENINLNMAYNEYVLTRTRLTSGINSDDILRNFGIKYQNYFEKNISKYLETEFVIKDKNLYYITTKGLYISDKIALDLINIQ